MKLYEIDSLYQSVVEEALAAAEQNGGEIPPDLALKLDGLAAARESKIEAIVGLYKNELAAYEMLDKEQKAIAERAKTHKNVAERLKSYLSGILREGEKLELRTGRVSWRRSERLIIDDESEVPDAWCRIERIPLKVEIKESIKAGAQYDWARIESVNNLQIK